jgi:hypothetical protein
MARRSLSYADAVHLLTSRDNTLRTAFERVVGFLMLGGALGGSEVLGLFDAKNELVRLSRELVRKAVERSAPSLDRTSRLEAAHTVIVVAAFFEGLAEVRLPVEITRGEQLALAGADLAAIHDFADQIQMVGRVVPSPVQEPESFRTELRVYYLELSDRLHQFISGLAEWDALPALERKRITRALGDTADRATERYQDSLRRLAVDVPEFRVWLGLQDHRQTRAALAEIARLLETTSETSASDAIRQRLALAYGSALTMPIVRLDQSFERSDFVSPTVEQAYVAPNFRTAAVSRDTPVSEESWWAEQPLREDLTEFLAAYLNSAEATSSLLMVLGHPGAGKSLLTEFLAARLPAERFVPVRVPLREVRVESSVGEQVEQAIRIAIAKPVGWSELMLAADGALPVLLLDGLDELIQTTGTHQNAYLERVRRFQHEQLAVGRPLAVIVTSRTVTADQVSIPRNTTAVRLESFDQGQVRRWLDIWNHANADVFARRSLTPLTMETVQGYGNFAMQPLLLLMLALYDAHENALQRHDGDSSPHLLYERLLWTFAAREVGKLSDGSSGHLLDESVEQDITKLSVAAFAMFNRGTQFVTKADLEGDLNALEMVPTAPRQRPEELSTAEETLGRFFFVHQQQAPTHGTLPPTYEFLHATFGEYLVARLIWQVLRNAAVRATFVHLSFTRTPAEDDLLATLLSHQPLSYRTPVLTFLEGLVRESLSSDQENVRRLLLTLFQNVDHERPQGHRAGYGPRSVREPARYATYAANLVLLRLCAGAVSASELYPDRSDAVNAWHDLTLFWRSQLSGHGWRSLVDTIALERVQDDERRDVRLTMRSEPQSQDVDLAWSLALDRAQHGHTNIPTADWLAKESYFQCGVRDALMHHALEPLTALVPDAATTITGDQHTLQSVAHVLLEVLVNPSPGAYRAAAAIPAPSWASEENIRFWNLLLGQLCTGAGTDPETAADVLTTFAAAARQDEIRTLGNVVLRCVLTHLGRKREADRVLARMVDITFDGGIEFADPVFAVDAVVRVHELGLPIESALETLRGGSALLLLRGAPIRPDLRLRLQALIDEQR